MSLCTGKKCRVSTSFVPSLKTVPLLTSTWDPSPAEDTNNSRNKTSMNLFQASVSLFRSRLVFRKKPNKGQDLQLEMAAFATHVLPAPPR